MRTTITVRRPSTGWRRATARADLEDEHRDVDRLQR
jgi:hypothetical protein